MPRLSCFRRPISIALAITLWVGTAAPLGVTPETSAQEQRPDCENFLDLVDAQVAFDAESSDPFGLDEQGEGDGEPCEDPAGIFGTPPLINCDDLRDHPAIAQALYDHSLAKYGSDRYELAACIEQGSTAADPAAGDGADGGNGGRGRDDPETLDGAPSDTGGSTVVVSTGAPATGATLEARLEARFAALEAQFAAFELRAANGFGRFPESDDDATAVDVSTSQQPTAVAQRSTITTGINQTALPQMAQGAKDVGTWIGAGQKARKDVKTERIKEGKGKRDRHKGKKRHRH